MESWSHMEGVNKICLGLFLISMERIDWYLQFIVEWLRKEGWYLWKVHYVWDPMYFMTTEFAMESTSCHRIEAFILKKCLSLVVVKKTLKIGTERAGMSAGIYRHP